MHNRRFVVEWLATQQQLLLTCHHSDGLLIGPQIGRSGVDLLVEATTIDWLLYTTLLCKGSLCCPVRYQRRRGMLSRRDD